MLPIIKRAMTVLALILIAVLFVAACGVAAEKTVGAQEEFVRPTVVPAEVLTPAPTPPDGRQVAILNLAIVSAGEGEIEKVTLEQGRIINSYAPNVLGLAGPWTVELVGEEPIRFGTLNPLVVRVYDEKQEVPHDVSQSETTMWELVVPLYNDGKDLQVREINIYDQNEKLIFTTIVDREAWRATENPG